MSTSLISSESSLGWTVSNSSGAGEVGSCRRFCNLLIPEYLLLSGHEEKLFLPASHFFPKNDHCCEEDDNCLDCCESLDEREVTRRTEVIEEHLELEVPESVRERSHIT